ncbi:hypothetical protein, partial [uncultured Paracoccus sp.]|uniref:hypothetical protein n=2 Tax=Paracoccus TaxID=265 RepID=UPI002593E2BA
RARKLANRHLQHHRAMVGGTRPKKASRGRGQNRGPLDDTSGQHRSGSYPAAQQPARSALQIGDLGVGHLIRAERHHVIDGELCQCGYNLLTHPARPLGTVQKRHERRFNRFLAVQNAIRVRAKIPGAKHHQSPQAVDDNPIEAQKIPKM